MSSTHFQDWLNLLAIAKTGPYTLKPAVRGQLWTFSFSVPGDLTTATLTGEVRSGPDSGTALAEFTIGTPAFNDGYTTWAISLAAGTGPNSTGSLPSDGDGNGTEYFPYDFLLKPSGGSAGRLFGGLLPLSGHITEPA